MKMLKKIISKRIDEKFKEIGFKKQEETKYGVIYKRYNKKYGYTHVIHLGHKHNGKHIVQSYDEKAVIGCDGNIGVGLTMHETKLCYQKMKALGWKENNNNQKRE